MTIRLAVSAFLAAVLVAGGAAAMAAAASGADAKLNVVTTTEDLASLAREVGGDRITVEPIARGYQDPHFVEAKPSFILKLQKADLLIVVGRELEIGWLPPLIQQSRNAKVQVGAEGLPRRVAGRPDSGDPDGPGHPGDGRRAPAGQPALLAGPRERPRDREVDLRQALAVQAGGSRRTSSSGWRTSTPG